MIRKARDRARESIKVLKNSALRDYLSASPTYVFHHIPKCGGTSAIYALSNWFHIVRDYRPRIMLVEETDEYLKDRINIANLKTRHCLCSHFELEGNYLHQRYPEVLTQKTRYRIFTFVRDPLELMISLYYYERENGYNSNTTLEEYLVYREDNFMANRFPCAEQNYKEVLSRYFFIGITEYLQESFEYLALILNKKKIEVPHVNRTERDEQSSGISTSTIKKFREKHTVDYKIYEYSLDKFEELRTKYQKSGRLEIAHGS